MVIPSCSSIPNMFDFSKNPAIPPYLRHLFRNEVRTVIVRVKDTHSTRTHVDFYYPYGLIQPQIGILDAAKYTTTESDSSPIVIDIINKVNNKNYLPLHQFFSKAGGNGLDGFECSSSLTKNDIFKFKWAVLPIIDYLDAELARQHAQLKLDEILRRWFNSQAYIRLRTKANEFKEWEDCEAKLFEVLTRSNFDTQLLNKKRLEHFRKRLRDEIDELDVETLEQIEAIARKKMKV